MSIVRLLNKKRIRSDTIYDAEDSNNGSVDDLVRKKPKLEDLENQDIHSIDSRTYFDSDNKLCTATTTSINVLCDDVFKEVMSYIDQYSVDLCMMRSSCLQWRRIVINDYDESDDTLWGVSERSVVENPNMLSLIEGQYKILPAHPRPESFLLIALKYGTLENIKMLLDVPLYCDTLENYIVANPLKSTHTVIAATRGNLKILQLLHCRSSAWGRSCPMDKHTFAAAARQGHFEVLKWLFEIRCPWNKRTFSSAAKFGNLEIMKWLKENGCPSDGETFNSAVKNGNFENLKWLKENDFPMYKGPIFGIATKCGNLKIMKWLKKKNGCVFRHDTLRYAAQNGNLKNMKWLIKHGCQIVRHGVTIATAIRKGIIENVKWLLEIGVPTNPNDIRCAAANGDYEMLDFLLTSGRWTWPLDKQLFLAAVIRGKFECIKLLKEKGCPMDSDEIFPAAATFGNLEIMKWLYSNGCTLNSNTFAAAAKRGDFENMMWLFENSCPWDALTFSAAARHGKIKIMKWLLENACPWDGNTITCAALKGNLEILRWLLENGCPFDKSTFSTASEYCNRDVLIWLLENGCPLSNRGISYSRGISYPIMNRLVEK